MLVSERQLNISKSSAFRSIHRSMEVVGAVSPSLIHFPEDIDLLKLSFYDKYHFPEVIGAIDCTHCEIDSVGVEQAETFRSRIGYFSLNIQAVCGSNLYFYNVVSR